MDGSLFPLPIFPPASLDSSVTTTVFVGVLVVAFFNLRLGWIFSGLVVPGYLVPLLFSRPVSVAVIVVEAMLVYLIVRVASDRMPQSVAWSSIFGRERFLALIMASVVTRLVLDGWLLPKLGPILARTLDWNFDYRSQLHSFGLVIVALLANQLWKPGLRKGLVQIATTTGITFLIVRWVLMEYTNFDLGSLEYMYEDIASSILASPKAYIILLTTAFLASRFNLLYGWEYSGVLIPALLALQWYQPTKLLASVVEAWAILGIASLLLASPLLRGRTVEKASKVALFFSVSYLYKYLLAFAVLFFAPQVKVSDVFGFGYLLPSLLAVKMHEKSIGLRMTRFTLQTTLISATVALIVGFAVTLVPRAQATTISTTARTVATDRDLLQPADGDPVDIGPSWKSVVQEARIDLYAGLREGSYSAPDAAELAIFAQGIRAIRDYASTLDDGLLNAGRERLSTLGLTVETLDGNYVLVREAVAERGWGFFLFRLRAAADGLTLEVPRPLDEWATAEGAVVLFEALGARALGVAGSSRRASDDGAADVLRRADTLFQEFHRVVGQRSVLQVRGMAAPDSLEPVATSSVTPESELWVKGRLPQALDLKSLEAAVGDYRIEWRRHPERSVQSASTRTGFVELHLNRADRLSLLLASGDATDSVEPRLYDQPIEGYLRQWLLASKGGLAERGSELYAPPRLEDLLFFDREVLAPILEATTSGYSEGSLTVDGKRAWQRAEIAAALRGYEVVWYRHVPTGRDYLVLKEKEPPSRYWGTYVFRLGAAEPFILEVPRPRLERRTFEVGVALFERLGGSALLIAGSHPYANADASSDMVRLEAKASVFNLVNQVLLREAAEEPRFVVLCRAFAQTDDPDEPGALLALEDGATSRDQLTALGKQLLEALELDAIEPAFVDGSALSAGYEVGNSPQSRYLDQTVDKSLAVLWLSAATRSSYRQLGEEGFRDDHFGLLGVASREEDVPRLLAEIRPAARGVEDLPALIDLLVHYVETADVMALSAVLERWPWLRLSRVVDRSSPRAFLFLQGEAGGLVAVVNLQLRSVGEPLIVRGEDTARALGRFVDQRRSIVVMESGS